MLLLLLLGMMMMIGGGSVDHHIHMFANTADDTAMLGSNYQVVPLFGQGRRYPLRGRIPLRKRHHNHLLLFLLIFLFLLLLLV